MSGLRWLRTIPLFKGLIVGLRAWGIGSPSSQVNFWYWSGCRKVRSPLSHHPWARSGVMCHGRFMWRGYLELACNERNFSATCFHEGNDSGLEHVWLVVWNIFYFSMYWEYSSQVTFIFFKRGWNHRPDVLFFHMLGMMLQSDLIQYQVTPLFLAQTCRQAPASAARHGPYVCGHVEFGAQIHLSGLSFDLISLDISGSSAPEIR